jgi:hypothetical protein
MATPPFLLEVLGNADLYCENLAGPLEVKLKKVAAIYLFILQYWGLNSGLRAC